MNVFVGGKNTRVPSCCASGFECGSSIGAATSTYPERLPWLIRIPTPTDEAESDGTASLFERARP